VVSNLSIQSKVQKNKDQDRKKERLCGNVSKRENEISHFRETTC
jgi:hypothetical protein